MPITILNGGVALSKGSVIQLDSPPTPCGGPFNPCGSGGNASPGGGQIFGPSVGTGTVGPINTPDQIIGLVPVFACCNPVDAKASFIYLEDYNFQAGLLYIKIGGVTYGPVSTIKSFSNSAVKTLIDAAILASGCTCSVSGNTQAGITILRTVTINTPVDSGSAFVGEELSISFVPADPTFIFYGRSILTDQLFSLPGDATPGSIACDCRQGLFKADSQADDQLFTLPVFASTTNTDSYHNDSNSFLFNYPGTYDAIASNDFSLEEYIAGVWTKVATLNDSTYGTVFKTLGTLCNNETNKAGYTISWKKVLAAFGEGTYRFAVNGSGFPNIYCLHSPPFCLKTWECQAVDGTVKFETTYSGGVFGSVTNQGSTWGMCCSNYKVTKGTAISSLIYCTMPASVNIPANSSLQFVVPSGYNLQQTTYTLPVNSTSLTFLNNVAAAINLYQLTLPSVQFVANVDSFILPGQNSLLIDCLDGNNITMNVNVIWKNLIGAILSFRSFSPPTNRCISGCTANQVGSDTHLNAIVGFSGGTQATTVSIGSLTPIPLQWADSIRFQGFFGYENAEFERKYIKYQTGIVDKIRDEAIKNFTLKSDRLPSWFHQRFYAYALQADHLYVSDYNINNSNYNYKHYGVIADSGYSPKYLNYSRYEKVLDIKFKEEQQRVYRTRCCS